MRIFVTGGTGFVGSHFLKLASKSGHEIVALRRSGSYLKITQADEPFWIEGALDEVPDEAIEGCDTLVHFAAHGVQFPTQASWQDCLRWNVIAFQSLMEGAIRAGITRYVIAGSCFEYGRAAERYKYIPADAPLEPTGPYHASKAAATMIALALAQQHRLQLSILRPFHAFGEGESEQRLWPSLKSAALAGLDFPMTLGEQVRDFVPVEAVADAFLQALSSPPTAGQPEILNIGSGLPLTVREFSELWWRRWNAKGRLLIGEQSYRPNEVMRYVPQVQNNSRQ